MKKMTKTLTSLLLIVMILVSSVPSAFASEKKASEKIEEINIVATKTVKDEVKSELAYAKVGDVAKWDQDTYSLCYGNQLSGTAKELYDGLTKYYVTDEKISTYSHILGKGQSFNVVLDKYGDITETAEYIDAYNEMIGAIQCAYDAFLLDNPQLFWLYSFMLDIDVQIYESSGKLRGKFIRVKFYPVEADDPDYDEDIDNYSSENIELFNINLDYHISKIQKSIGTTVTTKYTLVKTIHDYIAKNAYYKYYSALDEYGNNWDNFGDYHADEYFHSPEAFFVGDGGYVCEGYAETFKIFCDRFNIPCVLVVGDAGGAHMWNYVMMDNGKWYLVDVTWDDGTTIEDTYLLTGAYEKGSGNIVINQERTPSTDFNGAEIFNFEYPKLENYKYTFSSSCIHQWIKTKTYVVNAASCTKNATYYEECALCNASSHGITNKTWEEYGTKTGHTYKTKTIPATTSANGYTIKGCTKCSYTSSSSKKTIYKIKKVYLSTDEYSYNGKTKKPSVKVYDSKGKKLKYGTDYTYKRPSSSKKVGTYYIRVTFCGKYSGTKSLEYIIYPAVTKVTKVTGGKNKITVKWSRKKSYCDGYILQVSTSSKFPKKDEVTWEFEYAKDSITCATIKFRGYKKGTKWYARVRCFYKHSDGYTYYGGWSNKKYAKMK